MKPKSKSTVGHDEMINNLEVPVFFNDRRAGSLKEENFQYLEPKNEYLEKWPNKKFISLKSENLTKKGLRTKKDDKLLFDNMASETQEMLDYLGKSKLNIYNRRQLATKTKYDD